MHDRDESNWPGKYFFCRLLYCVALRISTKIPASFPLINCRFESGMLYNKLTKNLRIVISNLLIEEKNTT